MWPQSLCDTKYMRNIISLCSNIVMWIENQKAMNIVLSRMFSIYNIRNNVFDLYIPFVYYSLLKYLKVTAVYLTHTFFFFIYQIYHTLNQTNISKMSLSFHIFYDHKITKKNFFLLNSWKICLLSNTIWGPLQQFTLKCSEKSVQIDKTGAKLQHKKTDCPQWTQK